MGITSKQIFNELEVIRKGIGRKQIPEEREAAFTELKTKLMAEGIAEEVINAQFAAFKAAFIDKKAVDEAQLKAEIKKVPNANPEQCNLKVFQAILPYAKLMSEVEQNANAIEHAYKLAVIFEDEQKALNYLENFIKMKPLVEKVMHDANLFALPTGKWDLEVWRKLCAKHMKEEEFRQTILPRADVLEEFIKQKAIEANKKLGRQKKGERIQAIMKKKGDIETDNSRYRELHKKDKTKLTPDEKTEMEGLVKSIKVKQRELAELGVSFDDNLDLMTLKAFKSTKDVDASKVLSYFLENRLTEKDYAKFLNLGSRTEAGKHIPDITIDGGEIGYPGYYLMKVDVMDDMQAARAACLGKLTDCCQSLSGEAGQPCTIHGLTKPNGGFYILCKGDIQHPKINDKLIGQCWVWRSQSEAIVFDSIEVSPSETKGEKTEKTQMTRDFYQHLGRTLVLQNHTPRVICGGTSGISNIVGQKAIFNQKENFKDYHEYCDSNQQRVIYDSERPYYTYGKDTVSNLKTEDLMMQALQNETVPLAKNKAFTQMINWALLEKREDILSKTKEMFQKGNQQEKFDTFLAAMVHFFETNPPDMNQIIRAIEENRLPIDAKNATGTTPLILAASMGLGDVCEKLIDKGAEIDAIDESGRTSLMLAVINKHADVCLKLIEKGANVNCVDIHGVTVLMEALRAGNAAVSQKLIEKGADTNIKTPLGDTLLQLAVYGRDLDKVCLQLIENDKNFNLEDHGGNALLLTAASRGHNELCRKLLEKGADINVKDNKNNSALMLAAQAGSSDTCLTLLNQGADFATKNNQGETLFMLAASSGLRNICLKLIEKGANVNDKNRDGGTALLIAAAKGFNDVCLQLIEKGADVNARDNDYNVALILAADNGLGDVCLKLIEKGAKIDIEDVNGSTPLMLVAQKGLYDVCQKLIEMGANVNAQDNENYTPLMAAAHAGHTEVCLLLIKNGAEIGNVDLQLLREKDPRISEALEARKRGSVNKTSRKAPLLFDRPAQPAENDKNKENVQPSTVASISPRRRT